MTRQEFRDHIAMLGYNPASFTRRLRELGDPRGASTISRNLTNYLSGVTEIPGLMIVVLNLMKRDPLAGMTNVVTHRRGRPPSRK